jgi:hypothetical protein
MHRDYGEKISSHKLIETINTYEFTSSILTAKVLISPQEVYFLLRKQLLFEPIKFWRGQGAVPT